MKTSGKFAIRSARGFHYYSVFVDSKDDEKKKNRYLSCECCTSPCSISAVCETGGCVTESYGQ